MNAFLVGSPLQYLCALSAKRQMQIPAAESCLIVTCPPNSFVRNFVQICKMITPQEWGEIHFLGDIDSLFAKWSSLRRLNRIQAGADWTRVFMGDYRARTMRHFANRSLGAEIFLLDDGNITPVIHADRLRGLPASAWWERIKRKVLGFEDQAPARVHYFTYYDLPAVPGVRVVRNDFSFLRELMGRGEPSDEVWFLGGPWLDLAWLPRDRFRQLMAAVTERYRGQRLVYFPHRRESAANYEWLSHEFGFEIRVLDVPIEWELVTRGKLPRVLASFFSSALDTCDQLFGDRLKFEAFFVPREWMTFEPIAHEASETYRRFEREGRIAVVGALGEGKSS